MKKIFLIILACSLSSVMFSQENKMLEISKEQITNFQKNNYEKIVQSFDETMKNALPAEKLKLVWEDLNSKCGKFLKYSEITESKIQNYSVTYVLCHFEKMNLIMKTVFNEKNQIAGLFFLPEGKE